MYDPLFIIVGDIIFLSPFPGVIKTNMSTVSFLIQLDSTGILCQQYAFLWTYDLNGFKSRVNRYVFSGHFLISFPICFYILIFYFLI